MATSPAALLTQLAAGIRPDGAGRAPSPAPLDAASFTDLLARAQAGRIASDRPVRIGPAAEGKVDPARLDALAVVTDAAEAAGATRLLAIADGKAITIDVLTRTIESVSDQTDASVFTGVDSVVVVPPGAAASDLMGMIASPKTATAGGGATDSRWLPGLEPVGNASVARLLEELGGGGARTTT